MPDRQAAQRFQILEEMAKVSRKIRTVFDARVREQGLTLARARTLLKISRCEAANQKELAEELEIETATLVRIIDGLEAQGLIARQEVEGDRRAKQVVLTPAGEALAHEVAQLAADLGREVLRGIAPEELTAALTITRRMAENLDAAAAGVAR